MVLKDEGEIEDGDEPTGQERWRTCAGAFASVLLAMLVVAVLVAVLQGAATVMDR